MSKDGVQFLPSEKTVPLDGEGSVLELALKHEISLAHSCGGMGSCTTCRVLVVTSREPLPARNEMEQDLADMRGFRDEERLACQLPPTPGLVVRIPEPR